jgi:hypothetical protein
VLHLVSVNERRSTIQNAGGNPAEALNMTVLPKKSCWHLRNADLSLRSWKSQRLGILSS